MKEYDYLIIGGGIAGASIAYWLGDERKVAVLEKESQPGYHTTGRSVAVYAEGYGPELARRLCKASHDFIMNPPDGFSEYPLQHALGLLFTAEEDQKEALYQLLAFVQQLTPEIHEVSVDKALKMVPVLRPDHYAAAFYDPFTVALDVNAIHMGYLSALKRSGGEVICDAGVSGMIRKDDRWHVETPQGTLVAPVVINASGSWADLVADMAGTRRIGIEPLRRTVINFQPPQGIEPGKWPGVMDVHERYYFKPDAGAIVASLCDETLDVPCDTQPDELDVAMTVDRIEQATTLDIRHLIQKWSGLRNFVPDKLPVLGYAEDVEGFFWFAAQGGWGIATSYALGETGAAMVQGRELSGRLQDFGINPQEMAPRRLWKHPSI